MKESIKRMLSPALSLLDRLQDKLDRPLGSFTYVTIKQLIIFFPVITACVIGSVGCLMSGIRLSCSTARIIVYCVFCSVLFTALSAIKNKKLRITAISLVLGLPTLLQVKVIIRLFWDKKKLDTEAEYLIILLLIAYIASLIALGVMRVNSFVSTASVAIGASIIGFNGAADEPPMWAIVLLCLSLCCLYLLTAWDRLTNTIGQRGTIRRLLPFLVLTIGMLFAVSPANYQRPPIADDIFSLFYNIIDFGESDNLIDGGRVVCYSDSEDLTQIGPRHISENYVMSVFTRSSGSLYLRGNSFANYTGESWRVLDPEQLERLPDTNSPILFNVNAGKATGFADDTEIGVSISSAQPLDVIYTTYFLDSIPAQGVWLDDSYIEPQEELLNYAMYYTEIDEAEIKPTNYDMIAGFEGLDSYERFVYENYLSLPDRIIQPLHSIAEQQGWLNMPDEQLIPAMAEYIQSTSTYDLDTPLTPKGEDFALYFLTESHRGYCVHFASALAVLLRSRGIPARYTYGYLAKVESGSFSAVTSLDAHAWVEYYLPGVGWLPIEATKSLTQTDGGEQSGTNTTAPTTEQTTTTTSTASTQTTQNQSPSSSDLIPPGLVEDNTTKPTDNGSNDKGGKGGAGWLLLLLIVPLLVSVLPIRRSIILRQRERKMGGDTNAQALALWREITRLTDALPDKEEVPERLLELAQRARFSNATLEPKQLAQLLSYRDRQKEALSHTESAVDRFVNKYIFVIY